MALLFHMGAPIAMTPVQPNHDAEVCVDRDRPGDHKTGIMASFRYSVLASLLAVGSLIAAGEGTAPPDTIYHHGNILTVDPKFTIVEALAVHDGRITATGTSEEIGKLAGSSTKLVDLQGRTVIPGLIDNHLHFMRDAVRWANEARIDGVTSRKEALAIIAAKAAGLKPGEPVLVPGGWGELQFADQPGAFTREELDLAAPANPVVLQKSYSAIIMNSLAEKASQQEVPSSTGESGPGMRGGGNRGQGGRQGQGGGMQAINRAMRQFTPKLTEEQTLASIQKFCGALNAMGLTAVYDVGLPMDGPMERIATLEKQGRLPLRVFNTLRYTANNPAQADEAVGLIGRSRPLQSDDWCGVIGIGEHTYSPIHDSAMRPTDYPPEDYQQFEKIAAAAAAGGWNIQEHAQQDLTIGHFLDIFERLHEHGPLARWTLAHCDTISPANLERAKKLGLTVALHNHTVKPPGKGGDSPPVKMIQESGIVWGLGSDGGVVAPINPFSALWWVVTGKIYPDRKVQEGTISREEALIAHTRSNAYLLFKEKDLGSLEQGKLADFVVLDRDYMTIPGDQIKEIKPVMTVVGGKVVYEEGNK